MIKFIKELIDKNNPKRTNTFIAIITCFVLSASVIGLTIACTASDKNLAPELAIVVGGLTGLSGGLYWSAKKYSPNQDLNREDNKE